MTKIEAQKIADRALTILQREMPEFKVSAAGGIIGVDATLKFTFAAAGEKGDAEARAFFEKHANYFGMEKTDYGRKFTSNGVEYVVSGFKINAAKNAVLATRADGKVYRFDEDVVIMHLARMAKAA